MTSTATSQMAEAMAAPEVAQASTEATENTPRSELREIVAIENVTVKTVKIHCGAGRKLVLSPLERRPVLDGELDDFDLTQAEAEQLVRRIYRKNGRADELWTPLGWAAGIAGFAYLVGGGMLADAVPRPLLVSYWVRGSGARTTLLNDTFWR